MVVTNKQIVQECFDGDRARECSWCPGHHSKKGICCFGHKYEDDDPQCFACPHRTACEPETYHYLTEMEGHYVDRPRRIQVPARPASSTGRRLPAYPSGQKSDLIAGRPDSPMQTQQQNTELVDPMRYRDRGFFKQMGLHAVWGAIEGMFSMLLNFMRDRRPQ